MIFLTLISSCVPCIIHFLDCYLALEFCAACGLNNTQRHLHVSWGCVRPLHSIYMGFASALHPLYILPRNEEACLHFEFARHFESHLARLPPFIRACKRQLPMNILLHVHYTIHVLYSQPTLLISINKLIN